MQWPAPIADWDINTLYRTLCGLNFETFQLPEAGSAWEALQFVLCEAQLERAHHHHVRQTWSRPGQADSITSPSQDSSHIPAGSTAKAQVPGTPTRTYPPPKKPKKRPEKSSIPYDDPPFVSLPYNNADPMNVPFCKSCHHLLNEDDHCYRRIFVDRRQQVEIDSWTGALMTCAPPDDFARTTVSFLQSHYRLAF